MILWFYYLNLLTSSTNWACKAQQQIFTYFSRIVYTLLLLTTLLTLLLVAPLGKRPLFMYLCTYQKSITFWKPWQSDSHLMQIAYCLFHFWSLSASRLPDKTYHSAFVTCASTSMWLQILNTRAIKMNSCEEQWRFVLFSRGQVRQEPAERARHPWYWQE